MLMKHQQRQGGRETEKHVKVMLGFDRVELKVCFMASGRYRNGGNMGSY